jgi:predicted DNA-binding protein
MGVWDMMYLQGKYRKTLELSWNLKFSEKTRAEFAEKAEAIREQMIRYMERVENYELANNVKERGFGDD